jgi:hypothetical protein
VAQARLCGEDHGVVQLEDGVGCGEHLAADGLLGGYGSRVADGEGVDAVVREGVDGELAELAF